jgi:hypothetical protein
MTILYAKGKRKEEGKEGLLDSKRQNSATKPAGLVVSETQHDLVFWRKLK